MPLPHPDMLAAIAEVGQRLQVELSECQLALIGSLYKVHRPEKTAWQTAKLLATTIACPEAGPGDHELKAFTAIVDDLDAGYWCATLEYD